MHGQPTFHFQAGEPAWTIALPDHTGDEQYLERLSASLAGSGRIGPEIVFYQSGGPMALRATVWDVYR